MSKANEAVFELAVDAFLEGVTECLPSPKEYRVPQQKAEAVLVKKGLLPKKVAA